MSPNRNLSLRQRDLPGNSPGTPLTEQFRYSNGCNFVIEGADDISMHQDQLEAYSAVVVSDGSCRKGIGDEVGDDG
jgi:hypothetical protein